MEVDRSMTLMALSDAHAAKCADDAQVMRE
jgi:hypothetical protein